MKKLQGIDSLNTAVAGASLSNSSGPKFAANNKLSDLHVLSSDGHTSSRSRPRIDAGSVPL